MPRAAVLCAVVAALWLGTPMAARAFDPGRATFTLEVNRNFVVPYRVFAVYVVPAGRLELRGAATSVEADAGELRREASGVWQWTAPDVPGFAVLTFSDGHDAIRLNAVILHPASQVDRGELNGYRIGPYPDPDGDPVYSPPEGFIELTPESLELELSPHFRLGQFPCKQSAGPEKYLVLREPLLLKLELLLERLDEAGVAAESFTVMSGYRTPAYNHAIGNVERSRHVFGGVADIYVDVAPRDDVMDDLNHDGILDYRDAQWLYGLADALFGQPMYAGLRGGLGVYRSTSAHGPFLHIDARGRRARWGLLP